MQVPTINALSMGLRVVDARLEFLGQVLLRVDATAQGRVPREEGAAVREGLRGLIGETKMRPATRLSVPMLENHDTA